MIESGTQKQIQLPKQDQPIAFQANLPLQLFQFNQQLSEIIIHMPKLRNGHQFSMRPTKDPHQATPRNPS